MDQPDFAGGEAAFVLLVAITTLGGDGGWGATRAGDTFVFDLRQGPVSAFAEPYDFVRFCLPAAALNELGSDGHLPRVRGLQTTPAPVRDPVMNGLALSLLPALEAPQTAASQFLDSIALAFHAHVTRHYGCRPASEGRSSPGLAKWQLRRIQAFVDAELERAISVSDLARECRLSASHFSRSFSSSTGTSPHRWLNARRVERAKQMLRGGSPELSQIALACGFVDQSHFTRVFSQIQGQSPGRWLRQHRN